MPKKYLVINADDFGLCHSANEAVFDLFQSGCLYSSTIMTPCPGAGEAIAFAAAHEQYAIGVHLTYYGSQDVNGMSVVVRTHTGVAQRTDATFVVDGGSADLECFIGPYREATVMRGFLHPGALMAGKVAFQMALMSSADSVVLDWSGVADPPPNPPASCLRSELETYLANYPDLQVVTGALQFEQFATMLANADDGAHSDLVLATENQMTGQKVGTINQLTGEYALDTTLLATYLGVDKLENSVLLAAYTAHPGEAFPKTIYPSQTTIGRVKEGRNTIVAFIDLDGDGEDTVGEPFGMKQNVEIGCHKGPEVLIELTDTSSVVPRIDISGDSDREIVFGANSGVEKTGGADDTGYTATLQIRRKLINGSSRINGVAVPMRTLASRVFVLDDRKYLHEGDVISDLRPDLDWQQLAQDAKKVEKKGSAYSVTYAIVETPAEGTNGVTLATFTRTFSSRGVATPVAPSQATPVYSAAPTFEFALPEKNEMTAFALEVKDAAGTTVYGTGIRPLPQRVPSAVNGGANKFVCKFTPPLYVDNPICANDQVSGKTFLDGSNYFWRVQLYNAAYPSRNKSAGAWSEWMEFQMDVGNANRYPTVPTGYGTVAAAVRYYGPAFQTLHLTNDVSVAITNDLGLIAWPVDQSIARATLVSNVNEYVDGVTNAADRLPESAIAVEYGYSLWTNAEEEVETEVTNWWARVTGTNVIDATLRSSRVVVQAFENADFTGKPLAETRVNGLGLMASLDDILTTNALLRGVKPGTVYLRAFLDSNNNGKRDRWEAWGYANDVASGRTTIYNPKGIAVEATAENLFRPPSAVIYVEDSDCNQNEVPDCFELYRFGDDVASPTPTPAPEEEDDPEPGPVDPVVTDDKDYDGLSVSEEDMTLPDQADTDGDGMWDGWELLFTQGESLADAQDCLPTDPVDPADATVAADGRRDGLRGGDAHARDA